MVKVTEIKTSQKKDGTTFTSLVLEGGLELIQSQQTGNFYGKSKKTLLNTTLSEEAAKEMVGQSLPGSIQRVPCEPYDFVIDKISGETITLHHTYSYSPLEEEVTITNRVTNDFADAAPFEAV